VWFKDTWLKKQIVTNTLDELNSCYEVFLPTINRRLAALDANPDPDPDPNPVPIPNPSRSVRPRSVFTTPSLPPRWLLIAAIALAFAYAAAWWRQTPNPYNPMKPDPNPSTTLSPTLILWFGTPTLTAALILTLTLTRWRHGAGATCPAAYHPCAVSAEYHPSADASSRTDPIGAPS